MNKPEIQCSFSKTRLAVTLSASALLLGLSISAPLQAVTFTEKVSVSSTGAEGDNTSALESFDSSASPPGISSNGRYVVFNSRASNFAANDINTTQDVFRRDRTKGITAVLTDPTVGFDSFWPSISANGRYVAFRTNTGLIPTDDCCSLDVYRKDMTTGQLRLAAGVGVHGTLGESPKLSANGNVVVFETQVQLDPLDTDGNIDMYAYDFTTGITQRVSVSSTGGNPDSRSFRPTLSTTGRYVAFSSVASNLVANDTNGVADVFVRDRQTGKTTLLSFNSNNGQLGNSNSGDAEISANGRYVVFVSDANNLVAGDTNNTTDVFVHDRTTHVTSRVSLSETGAQASLGGHSPFVSSSVNGTFVAFVSGSPLVANDTNGVNDIFVRDIINNTTTRISVDSAGNEANNNSWNPTMSGDGNFVIFNSSATNLVTNDTNGLIPDVFIRRWRP